MSDHCDVLIIGGGFYGLYLADHLAARVGRVVLCEEGPVLMRRASYANQARVHNGYHYPRSFLTAVRSRVNFPRFTAEFPEAIVDSFEKVYAVARRESKVTAAQFVESMRRVGAPIRQAPAPIAKLFDPTYISASFLVEEVAFDAVRLCDLLAARARRSGVDIRLSTTVDVVRRRDGEHLEVDLESPAGPTTIRARHVFGCGYAQLNGPTARSGLPVIPLKHELAEMALVEVPDELRDLGITVMDGPFFSLMPFPSRGLHTLSHVRYTPHAHWYDGADDPAAPLASADRTRTDLAERRSAFPHMIRDAARYLPGIARSVYRDSLWEIKTLLPRSETDDSRPILFRPDHGLTGYHLVMGGKIDNVYDVADEVDHKFNGFRE